MSNLDLHKLITRCIDIAPSGGNDKPYVGALLVDASGNIIAESAQIYHPNLDEVVHAERAVLDKAGWRARNSTLVTTLYPCERKKGLISSTAYQIHASGIVEVVYGAEQLTANHNAERNDWLMNNGVKMTPYYVLRDRIFSELMDDHNRELYEEHRSMKSSSKFR